MDPATEVLGMAGAQTGAHLNAGEVKDVAYEGEQRLAGAAHSVDEVPLRG